MKVALIRGSYFNRYEMQNYEPLTDQYNLVGFSGLRPIHNKFSFPLVKLPSPVDLPDFPYKMAVLNRLCLGDAMYLFGLERQLKGFDVAHVRETYFHFTQQALRAKERGWVEKVVCTCSETIPHNHQGIWNRKRFKEKAIDKVDLFHCLTQKAKQCLVEEGCSADKIIVFPYGVDIDQFKPREKERGKGSKIRLLFVGRLVKEKGIYDLLKVYEKLVETRDNIELVLIGRGPEKSRLINLINQSQKLSRLFSKKKISFKLVEYPAIAAEYQKSDIFILLSKPTKHWEEYLGMAIIEAMASGLPVVSSYSGAIPEVVGRAGFLVKPGDWQAAFKAVERLIQHQDLRRELGLQARSRAEKFYNWRLVGRKIAELWEEA